MTPVIVADVDRSADILVARLMNTLGEQAKLERIASGLVRELGSELIATIARQPELDLTDCSNITLQRIALTGIAVTARHERLLRSPEVTAQASQIVQTLAKTGAAVLALNTPDQPRFGAIKTTTVYPNTPAQDLVTAITLANAHRKTTTVQALLSADILVPRLGQSDSPPDTQLYLGQQETSHVFAGVYQSATTQAVATHNHQITRAIVDSGYPLRRLHYPNGLISVMRAQLDEYLRAPTLPYSGQALQQVPLGISPSSALRTATRLGDTHPELEPEGTGLSTLGYDLAFLRDIARAARPSRYSPESQ